MTLQERLDKIIAHTQAERSQELKSGPEHFYSVPELARLKNLSDDTIRRMFAHEPEVIRIGRPGNERARGYHRLRIPGSVVNRVFAKLAVKAGA